jgi:hypothetical protein
MNFIFKKKTKIFVFLKSTSTKQAREAAKSHIWDKKVARLNQQRDLKPKFGCIHDSTLDENIRLELLNYLHQFQVNFN